MKRAARIAMLLACGALAARVAPQGFAAPPERGPPPGLALDAIPDPPALAESNAVTDLARAIQAEVLAIAKQPPSVPRDTMLAYRRVTYDLLFHGLAAPTMQQAMVIAGLRLAESRAEIDTLVCKQLPPEAGGDAAQEALAAFVRGASNGLVRIPPADRPEDALGVTLAPLQRAVALLDGRKIELGAAWPTLAQLTAPTSPVAPTAEDASPRFEESFAAAAWLTGAAREALARATATAQESGNPAQLRLVSDIARALTAATALTRGGGAWDPAPLRNAFGALAATMGIESTQTLADALEAALLARDYDLEAIRTDLRPAARDIQANARRLAPKLALQLESIVRARDPLADPTLATSVLTQLEAGADLRRLCAAGSWVDAIGALRATSRDPFDAVVKRWALSLREVGRREETRAQMDAFAAQLALFDPLRLEQRIRGGQPAALEACAGRSQELLAEIDRRRGAWAAAWATGKGHGDASMKMLRLARVMEMLAASAALATDAPAERRLGRWGGFSAPHDGMGVHPRALAARNALAIEALLEGREAEVDAQLGKLDVDLPVAWLVAQLSERLGPWLETRLGAGVQLQSAACGPAPDAWLAEERPLLMLFSRYAREEARARALQEEELAGKLRAYLAEIALRVGPGLGRAPGRLPALRAVADDLRTRTAKPRPGAASPRVPTGNAPKSGERQKP